MTEVILSFTRFPNSTMSKVRSLFFFHVSVTAEHSAAPRPLYHLAAPVAFGYVVSLIALPVSSSPSPRFFPLTFLFSALCIFYWKCHCHTTHCPSPLSSDSVSSASPSPVLSCQIMSIPVCSSPILAVSQPALSLSPHYSLPCLLFPRPPQTDTVALPAPFLSSPLRQRGGLALELDIS